MLKAKTRNNLFPAKHLILLHFAALLFGGTPLFIRQLPFSANDIILSRSIIVVVVLGLFLLISARNRFKILSLSDLMMIVFSGVLFGVHLVSYFYAIRISSIGIAVISLFTFPILITLIEPLILRKIPRKQDVLLSLLVLVGVSLIAYDSGAKENLLKGLAMGLVSALSYAVRNLLLKYRLANYAPVSMLFYQLLVTFLMLLPLSTINFTTVSMNEASLLLILSIVFTIGTHLSVIESLKHFDARSVSVVLSLQVFYAILFAFLIYNESLSASVIIGAILVLFVVSYESVHLYWKENILSRRKKMQ